MATLLQILNADRNLSLMARTIKASGLEDKLNGPGPFTLLAPVNLAFGKLNATGSYDQAMKPERLIADLDALINLHILTTKKMHRDFRNGEKLRTLGGQDITVVVRDGQVSVNGALILARNMQGSNGVVHQVDKINIPGS